MTGGHNQCRHLHCALEAKHPQSTCYARFAMLEFREDDRIVSDLIVRNPHCPVRIPQRDALVNTRGSRRRFVFGLRIT
jgi:hypothetical protein